MLLERHRTGPEFSIARLCRAYLHASHSKTMIVIAGISPSLRRKFVFKPPRVDGAFIESKGAPLVQPITAPPPTQPLTESSMEPIRASQTDEVCQDTKEILKDAAVFQAEVNLSHDVFPAEVTLNNGEEGAPAVQAKPKKNVRAAKVQKPPEPCWFPMSDIKEKRGAIKNPHDSKPKGVWKVCRTRQPKSREQVVVIATGNDERTYRLLARDAEDHAHGRSSARLYS